MKTEYGKHTIIYNEHLEKFEVNIGGSQMTNQKLSDLKKRIDALEKKEKKFERINILKDPRWGDDDFEEGQITSIAESTGYNRLTEVWVVIDKKRSKITLDNLYLDTPENRDVFDKIETLKKGIKKTEDRISTLKDDMEKPSIPKEAED